MARIFISVGSNIDREDNIKNAVVAMEELFSDLVLSTVFESESLGFDGDDFYNLVVVATTESDVDQVRFQLRQIEIQQGRKRGDPRFSSRTIDLDLLLYDELVVQQDNFELPRPEITEYAFVLCPLAEVAPDVRHPVTGEPYAALWGKFDKSSQPLVKTNMTFASV